MPGAEQSTSATASPHAPPGTARVLVASNRGPVAFAARPPRGGGGGPRAAGAGGGGGGGGGGAPG
ncbi:hypothetical protein MXD60_25965, partial [Frankia sp. AgB32]